MDRVRTADEQDPGVQASREMIFEQSIEKQVGIYYVEEYGPRFSRQRGMVEDWGCTGQTPSFAGEFESTRKPLKKKFFFLYLKKDMLM